MRCRSSVSCCSVCVGDVVRDAAILLEPEAEVYSLIRWPGLKTAFVISMGIVAAGTPLGLFLARRTDLVPRPSAPMPPTPWSTSRCEPRAVSLVACSTARFPATSSPPPSSPLRRRCRSRFAVRLDALDWRGRPIVPFLGLLIVLGAIGTVRVPTRLGAALGLGSVGFGMAGVFVAQGAPDLALTQLLVETVVVVGFVIGLGYLNRDFPPVGQVWRTVRMVVSLAIGAGVSIGLAAAAAGRAGPTAGDPLVEARRPRFGHGRRR